MPIIPWDDVETLVKAGMSVQGIADKLNMPDEFERIKRQVTRKGWIKSSPAVILETATKQLQTLKAEIVPNVPSASQILANTGENTKSKLAIAALKVAEQAAEQDADTLLRGSEDYSRWVSNAAKIHGWDAIERSGGQQTVVNICFLSPASVDMQGPVIEQE